MKKVGLLTCYIDNYGANLQAYALQTVINDLGHNCEIVRYTPYRRYNNSVVLNMLVSVLRLLRALANPHRRYDIARHRYMNRFRNKYLKFGKRNYATIKSLYKNIPEYDAFVTGSDQLWNPVIHHNTNNKAYFLDFVPEGKSRIAYAPSIGLTTLPDEFKEEMKTMLMRFDALSTREQAGADIVTELTGKPCRVVLDPTLLISKDEWSKLAVKPDINEPYIICYLFGKPDYIGKFVEYAAEKTGYRVFVIPFYEREYNSSYEKVKDAGPLEFIGLIKNAALVITDSFHATAFSINFNVPFYSLLRNTDNDRNNMNSRIFNILNLTGLQDRLISSEKEFPDDITKRIDYTGVNKALSKKRALDKEYLKNALEV